MARLFTSIMDVHLLGQAFVDRMNWFYDQVDAIQVAHAAVLAPDQLEENIRFMKPGNVITELLFENSELIPDAIMEEVFRAFQTAFQVQKNPPGLVG